VTTTPRMSVITDWRTKEDDLPDVAPGEEYEYVIAPQKFVVLHRIRVVNSLPGGDLTLVRLKIGAIEDVPFELDRVDGLVRTYRLKGLDNEDLKKLLVRTGAAAMKAAIAIAPALEVRAVLRNEGTRAAKPRAALIVQEEEAS
jgi:hypothetical protein